MRRSRPRAVGVGQRVLQKRVDVVIARRVGVHGFAVELAQPVNGDTEGGDTGGR